MEMSATTVFCGRPEERRPRCGTSLQPCPLSWGWDKSWQTLPAPCSFSWCLTIKSDMWEVISKSLTWEKYLAWISLLHFMYSSEIFSVVSWIYFSHLSYGLIRDGNWWPLLLNLDRGLPWWLPCEHLRAPSASRCTKARRNLSPAGLSPEEEQYMDM